MQKLLNVLLCFALFTFVSSQAAIIEITPANAKMMNLIAGPVLTAGSTTSEVFNDLFVDDITGWNTISGGWEHDNVNDEIQCTWSASDCVTYYVTSALTAVNGWAMVRLVDADGGIAFRTTGTGSEGFYAMRYVNGESQLKLAYWTDGGQQETIATNPDPDFDAEDYMGITWTGLGDSLVVSVWDLGAAPCENKPYDVDNWCAASDAAEHVFTGLTITNEVDVGLYVGIGTYNDTDYGAFYAGDL